MNEVPVNLKHTLADLRIRAGLSQSDLAKKLGVSKTTISNWEQDSSNINYKNVVKISEFFHVPIDYIFLGTQLSFRQLMKENGYK